MLRKYKDRIRRKSRSIKKKKPRHRSLLRFARVHLVDSRRCKNPLEILACSFSSRVERKNLRTLLNKRAARVSLNLIFNPINFFVINYKNVTANLTN
ncbi:hypothetical protein PUN28_012352 [Cardiocondyla obscurior]|uniref:Ribosomal protein S20 n=1 Tax=Cardiocondyla obscurior TaxID=286306 RepID=A0AAW2FDP6_9HYME